MRSEAMGKTMAIFLVMAMIATGIVLFPESTDATGAYTVTGHLKDDVTDANVGGVRVTITNTTLSVDKNVTSTSDGKFSISVQERGNYTLTFEKSTYRTKSIDLLNETFNQTSKKADVGIQLITPLPTVSGTVMELGTTNVINDAEVTVKDGNSVIVIEQVMSANGKFSVPVDTDKVDIYFKKNGYYDNKNEHVAVVGYGTTDVGTVFLEKIVPTPTILVWGVVFDDETKGTLKGAVVSISAGDEKWITAVSDDDGYYEMMAFPGNFQIKCSLMTYKSSLPEWFNVPSDKSVRKNIYLEKTPPETRWISGIVYQEDGLTAIKGADIYLHSTDGKYVNHTTSNATTGEYNMSFYPPSGLDSFVLEVRFAGYFTNASVTGITQNTSKHVRLTEITSDQKLRGFVFDIEKETPLKDVTVTIYSKDYLYTNTTKTKSNGHFDFWVHDNSDFWVAFEMVGYQSEVMSENDIKKERLLQVGLHPSGSDTVETTYTFVDWNTITVTRNSIITVNNVSVRWNADRKWGMGSVGLTVNNGTLGAGEIQAWARNLELKGAEKRNTREFLTLNNTYYLLNATTYNVTIEGAEGPISNATTIYINSTYNYTLAKPLENPDSDIFTLVLNATYDTKFLDYVNHIILPFHPDHPNNPMFEMTANTTETNKVVVTGYNDPITIDPMVHDADTETVTMTVERADNGTAKAKIISGVHHILNRTYDNYTVIVAMGPSGSRDTTVKLSAEDSTDKIGDIAKANFTWNFGDGTWGYGRKVEHNYTNASHDGELTVRLVITETGGNKTYRNITVWVDSQDPVAGISAHLHDPDNMTFAGNTLTINEDTPVTFSGSKFSDVEGMDMTDVKGVASYDDIKLNDRKGIIEKWYWSWGEEDSFDETVTKEGSHNITHAYSKPGTYTINMIATDVVGRESAVNATWIIMVNDITPPLPDFKFTDPEFPNLALTEVIENKEFQFNASLTTDNSDELANLTFEWIFEVGGTTHNYAGMVVNFTFSEVGMYNVTLKATDKANNTANKTTLVYVNLGLRPNILMRLGTLAFSSSPGTAGKAMTVSVNITNDGQANATGIQTTFYIRNPDGSDKEIGTVTTSFLEMGETATASISWTPKKKGDFTIWANATCPGEHSSQWWDNKIDDFSVQRVTVKEASWVMPAIVASVVVVIVVVFFGMKYFMKTGTKDEDFGEKRKKR